MKIPVGIERMERTDYHFQSRYMPTFECIGHHYFVRLSSLTDNEIGTIYRGYDKKRILKEIGEYDDLQRITIPIYEECLLLDKFVFVSYLGLDTIFFKNNKLVRGSVREFFENLNFKDIDDEFQIYFDSLKKTA